MRAMVFVMMFTEFDLANQYRRAFLGGFCTNRVDGKMVLGRGQLVTSIGSL